MVGSNGVSGELKSYITHAVKIGLWNHVIQLFNIMS